ncbi:hypothetical protein Achl_3371 [Pseudarthrobacter chlorophenolicus A6]|uniref:Uncharacterized protein n=1 Tax=Pseudarthrobacter chlorophenolicus (strain ATCC 700700 / DSM 12829 / CIP 107037 / JCM 12360 / KCTC 9906 / NCIMB 13794 / A6) TaxID=452863 RepID=B8HGR2_PSECP|nr:hypothetical protein [Pseudarthrobacter chlorophenolicus]ACL41328.1 hypothetical protein Achl_3371 [Pseudarthrobacter chlorophenolicus A6]SDQ66159.1 hypothetical protein SAMN04489738_2108 [Pseudarthrobacter chlorophenolicus]
MTTNSPDSLPDDESQAGENQEKRDGGVPGGKDGVGIGADAEPNTFEPEEDPDATKEPDGD